MTLQDMRGKDDRDLELDLEALRKEEFQLRFRGSSEGVQQPSRFKEIRREIARIHTVRTERAMKNAAAAAPRSEA